MVVAIAGCGGAASWDRGIGAVSSKWSNRIDISQGHNKEQYDQIAKQIELTVRWLVRLMVRLMVMLWARLWARWFCKFKRSNRIDISQGHNEEQYDQMAKQIELTVRW